MADIRINSLPTTASASSSDDFLALDGATNGTRKLNAYSPTFGGNVTASGNLTVSGVTTSAGISNSGALTFTAAIGQVAGSIAKNATYGLTYYGVTGSSNDNTILNASGAVVLSNPAGTTNAILAGNLTLSGTGTSSVAGNLNIGEPTGSGYRLYVKAGFGLALGGSYIECGEYDKPCSILNHTNPAVSANLFQIQKQGSGVFTVSSAGNLGIGTTSPVTTLNVVKTLGSSGTIANSLLHLGSAGSLGNIYPITFGYSGSSAVNPPAFIGMQITDANSYTNGALVFGVRSVTTDTLPSEAMRVASSGNLLIGTTTDSANGKLQLATHTTSAGGIGFGTDTALYRYGAGRLGLTHIGGNTPILYLLEGTTETARLWTANGPCYLDTLTAQPIYFRPNGTTALTLDSSQNATFAGDVGLSGNEKYLNLFSTYIVGSNSRARLRAVGSGGGSGYGGSFTVDTRTSGNTFITALTIDDAQNATFAGGIIGMTQGNVDNISDDGVASFTPLYNRGFIVINNPDYSQNALIAYFKAGSSYLLYSITKSADVTLNNSTTLTGTTGTDGKLNIGYNNSIIYIENRLGGIGNFQRYALGGTN